jgi:pSer/pThr/pTyr-binding forkhead associated (FHA) protein
MRVIQSFERRLQGAVGNTFARLFGGRVQPAEVADALQREAAEHISQQGTTTIAPNHYRVRLGPTDRQGLGADEVSVASALSDMIREYLDEQGWQTFGDVAVSLEQSESLHTGQFRISSIVDPDVGRRSPQARSGVGRMTQQPGDSGRSEHRGDPGQPGQGRDPQQDQRDQGQYGPPGYPGQYGPPDQGQGYPGGYQGPNPGYPPQPYDAPGYGQRVWDQQGQQWEQQWGQQPPPQGSGQASAQQGPPPGYPQQPYQQGPPQPNWDPGYQQGYPAQGYGQGQQGQQYPQNYGQNYGVPAAAPQEITATLSIDDGSGRSHQLQRGSNVIGRGQDASFRLADTSVSRRHVDVYFDGQSAVLHDLGSTNGTTVNGSSVQTWQLADGDVIHIGHSTVVFSSRY